MRRVGKSKVTKLNAKAGAVYPLIRLPRAYGDEIGKVAEIFEIHDRKKEQFLLLFPEVSDLLRSLSLILKLYNLRLKLYNLMAQIALNRVF